MRPMFTLNGTVIHVFETPKGVNKKTGEEYNSQDKVQVLGDVPLLNGQTRKDMITITTHDIANIKTMLGKAVSLPVGIIAQGKGLITYFMPKGSRAELDTFSPLSKTA
jgi:hypothetical protein